ncbi:MAG: hypothetical protein ACTSSK_17850 [Candidatus Heimdallarchaeota archaeon]
MTNLVDYTIKLAQKEGATEVIARLIQSPDYQIRFSNSNIDIAKKWDTNLLEVFIALGRKTTQVDIQDPNEKKIEATMKRAIGFASKLPESQMFAGLEKEIKKHQMVDGLYDKNVENLYETAPELVNVAIKKISTKQHLNWLM